uniref:Uncharacterized protein n=1 Tax=Plectus sambesii TaxID=2011161 RepID=A0A914WT64_9BILA
MRRELNKVFASLVIAAIAVVLSTVPNFILWGQGIYWAVSGINISLLYIGFCCNSAVDLFVFAYLKVDFRNRLLSMISYGYLNRYFKLSDGCEETLANMRMVRGISVRPAVVTPISDVVEIAALHRRPAKVRFQEIARRAAHEKLSRNTSVESNE